MNYKCPACSGRIEVDESSTATVYVCPHCSATGNMSRLKEGGELAADATSAPMPPPQAPPAPPPPAAAPPPAQGSSDALEPITGATASEPKPEGMAPTMNYGSGEGESKGFLKDFEQGNIFDQIEDEEPIFSNNAGASPPPPPAPAAPAPPAPPAAENLLDVECPICKSVNQVSSSASGMYNCASCGSLFSPVTQAPDMHAPQDILVNQQVGGCRMLNKIGEGGMGAVYKGTQLSLDRDVAIKILPGQYSRNRSFIQRFEREAKSLAKINHQNIMQIYDFGMHGDLYYMVMEFIDGSSLSDHLEERYVIPLEQLLPIVKQAAMGLECAQRNGVIHRDVKPDNIMIDSGGVVKMTDFGLAKIIGSGISELTQEGVRVGTPAFMSPEQCKGQKSLDVRTDIYSLGVTFYFALSGKLPFTGDSPFSIMLKHQNQKATPLKNIIPGLPEAVSEIVERMMEKDPGDRYQTWLDFLDAIQAVERFMSIELPDATGEPIMDEKSKMDTMDIDMQKHAEELPEDWHGDTPDGPVPPEEAGTGIQDLEKLEQINTLIQEGDDKFQANGYDDAINIWQKALFLDPNNIKIQDKISEARGRLRQQKIEVMLEEASGLEKRGKYKAALIQFDEILKMKLAWQVKDMVGKSLNRIQEKMRKRKMFFGIVRLILLFVALFALVLFGYPSYLLYRSSQEFQKAEQLKKSALQMIDRDYIEFKKRAGAAVTKYSEVIGYRVPSKGLLGELFKRIAKENKFVDESENQVAVLEKLVIEAGIRDILTKAGDKAGTLLEEGKYFKALAVLEAGIAELGDLIDKVENPESFLALISEIRAELTSKTKEAQGILAAAREADVFEKEGEADLERLAAYEHVEKALEKYTKLRSAFPETELGQKAKVRFKINSKPENASVTIIREDGKEITITGKQTPLTIPIARPNPLFTIVLRKEGFKPFVKKVRDGMIERSGETFTLEVGPFWKAKTPERKPIKSQPLIFGERLVFLGHNKLFAVEIADGHFVWDESDYIKDNSPLVSHFFNGEQNIGIADDMIIVPGINGKFFVITMSQRQAGEWLRREIDVRPGTSVTGPVLLKPPLHPGKTGIYFGGGPGTGFVGAVALDDGSSLWGETVLEEGKKKIKGKSVEGDVIRPLVAAANSVFAVTTLGKIYDLDINTGTIKRIITVPAGRDSGVITVAGEFLYYAGQIQEETSSMIYKYKIEGGEKLWERKLTGHVPPDSPIIIEDKLVMGMGSSNRGEVMALSLDDGSILWSYPPKGEKPIRPVTSGVVNRRNLIFCPSERGILIIGTDGSLKHDQYETQFGKITRPLIVRGNHVYAFTGYGYVYSFLIPPALQDQ